MICVLCNTLRNNNNGKTIKNNNLFLNYLQTWENQQQLGNAF